MMKNPLPVLGLCCALLLSACGGGGGGASTTTPPPVVDSGFALQKAFKARVTAGYTDDFTVTGSCSGTATMTAGAAVAASFEGQDGFSATQSAQVNLTDCTPTSKLVSGTGYVDANFAPLGGVVTGLEYAKFVALPTAWPASVKVGDAGSLVVLSTYTSSTKLVPTGRHSLTYVVEADTASSASTSAIVNLTTRVYSATDLLLSTQQARYRIDAAGTLAMVSIDIQYSNTSTNHLLYTAKRAVASSATFALRSAYQARLAAGGTESLLVSGTCSGTATLVAAKPAALTFEGVSGFSVSEVNTLQLTNCSPATLVIQDVTYFDSNANPLGASQPGVDYARYTALPTAWPATVQVGDAATVVNLNVFTDAAQTVFTGHRTMGYVVEPDTSSTAIINFTTRSYTPADVLLLTQQTRYRIDSGGSLSLLSIDVQYSATSAVHLVYTSTRPVGATTQYPLAKAYQTRWNAGSSDRFTVSGTCNGTATLSESVPVASNFEGLAAFATSQSALISLTDCIPGTTAIAATSYYDGNQALLGVNTPGLEYTKAQGTPTGFPATVQVGDTATLVTLNVYSDNTKTVGTGRKLVGYLVEPDTVGTAIVNFTTRSYNSADQLLSTQQARYRIDATGNLKVVGIDVQNSTTNTAHLVYTPTPGTFTLVPVWP